MARHEANSNAERVLTNALERLRDELAVVRQVLDEILDELQWANRNRRDQDDSWRVARSITSMPVDSCAPDWAQRLNRYSAADLPNEESNTPAAEPGRLF